MSACLEAGKVILQGLKRVEPWKKYSGDFISADAFLETLVNSLTGNKDAPFTEAQLNPGTQSVILKDAPPDMP